MKVGQRATRSDARENAEAILRAGLEVLSADPQAGLAQVAKRSGLTRTTIYAHFRRREDLIEALVSRAMEDAATSIDQGEPTRGTAVEALIRVARVSWRQVDHYGGITATASRILGAERMNQLHEPVRERLAALLERGRADGSIRSDTPLDWLIALYFSLVHLTGEQTSSGALPAEQAESVLTTTLAAAVAPSREARPGEP